MHHSPPDDTQTATSRSAWLVVPFLSLLSLTYLYLHFSALPPVRDQFIGEIFGGSTRGIDLAHMARVVAPALIAPCAIALLSLIALIIAEIKWRALSQCLESLEDMPRRSLLAVILFTAVTGAIYLAPGDLILGDTNTHISRARYFLEELRLGKPPIWSFVWYMGYPFGQFYSQMTNILLAPLIVLLGNVMAATKVLVFLAHVAGGIGVYLFLRSWTSRTLPGIVGAVAYSIMRQHIVLVMLNGKIPAAVFLAILPYAFLFAHKLTRERTLVSTCLLACALALLVHTHLGILPRLAPYWILFLVVLVARSGVTGGLRATIIARICGAHILALGLCLGLILPIFLERQFVTFPSLTRIATPPASAWVSLVKWQLLGPFYQGTALPLMAILAAVLARGFNRWLAITLILGACLSFWLWGLEARSLALLCLTLAVSVGLVVSRHFRGLRTGRIVAVALAVLLLDQGPYLLLNTYTSHGDVRLESEPTIERICQDFPPAGCRVVEGRLMKNRFSVNPWKVYDSSRILTVGGPFIQGSTQAFKYADAMLANVAYTINETGSLDKLGADCMALMNVGLILGGSRNGYENIPLQESPYATRVDDMPGLRAKHSFPALFSTSFSQMPDSLRQLHRRPHGLQLIRKDPSRYKKDEAVLETVRSMQIDLSRAAAKRFYKSWDHEEDFDSAWDWGASDSEPTGLHHGPLEFIEHEWSGQDVSLKIRAPENGYLRLSYSHYPYLACKVDGNLTRSRPDAFGAITIPIAEGEHNVTLSPYLSNTRKVTAIVALCSLILCLAVFALALAARRKTSAQ